MTDRKFTADTPWSELKGDMPDGLYRAITKGVSGGYFSADMRTLTLGQVVEALSLDFPSHRMQLHRRVKGEEIGVSSIEGAGPSSIMAAIRYFKNIGFPLEGGEAYEQASALQGRTGLGASGQKFLAENGMTLENAAERLVVIKQGRTRDVFMLYDLQQNKTLSLPHGVHLDQLEHAVATTGKELRHVPFGRLVEVRKKAEGLDADTARQWTRVAGRKDIPLS